jgi:hypothetical protein
MCGQPSRQHAGKAHLLGADRLADCFHARIEPLQTWRRFPSLKIFFGRRDGEHQAPRPLLIEHADERRSPARPLAHAKIRVAPEHLLRCRIGQEDDLDHGEEAIEQSDDRENKPIADEQK